MCCNGALSELCDFLDFGRCIEFILKLKDSSKQDLHKYRILSLVHSPSTRLNKSKNLLYSHFLTNRLASQILCTSIIAIKSADASKHNQHRIKISCNYVTPRFSHFDYHFLLRLPSSNCILLWTTLCTKR